MLEAYSENSQNFWSTLEISASIDKSTYDSIYKQCRNKFGVEVKLIPGPIYSTLKIIGFQHTQAKAEVHRIIQRDSQDSGPKYPFTWRKLLDFKTLMILDVKKGKREWNEVEENFQKTLPKSTIIRIQRIQNKVLWNTFQTSVNNY